MVDSADARSRLRNAYCANAVRPDERPACRFDRLFLVTGKYELHILFNRIILFRIKKKLKYALYHRLPILSRHPFEFVLRPHLIRIDQRRRRSCRPRRLNGRLFYLRCTFGGFVITFRIRRTIKVRRELFVDFVIFQIERSFQVRGGALEKRGNITTNGKLGGHADWPSYCACGKNRYSRAPATYVDEKGRLSCVARFGLSKRMFTNTQAQLVSD